MLERNLLNINLRNSTDNKNNISSSSINLLSDNRIKSNLILSFERGLNLNIRGGNFNYASRNKYLITKKQVSNPAYYPSQRGGPPVPTPQRGGAGAGGDGVNRQTFNFANELKLSFEANNNFDRASSVGFQKNLLEHVTSIKKSPVKLSYFPVVPREFPSSRPSSWELPTFVESGQPREDLIGSSVGDVLVSKGFDFQDKNNFIQNDTSLKTTLKKQKSFSDNGLLSLKTTNNMFSSRTSNLPLNYFCLSIKERKNDSFLVLTNYIKLLTKNIKSNFSPYKFRLSYLPQLSLFSKPYPYRFPRELTVSKLSKIGYRGVDNIKLKYHKNNLDLNY